MHFKVTSHFTHIKRDLYVKNNEDFSQFTHLDHDACIIHDPQPLPLIRFYKKDNHGFGGTY